MATPLAAMASLLAAAVLVVAVVTGQAVRAAVASSATVVEASLPVAVAATRPPRAEARPRLLKGRTLIKTSRSNVPDDFSGSVLLRF